MTCRKRTGSRARICSIDGRVRKTIEGHSGRACANHRDNDPYQLVRAREPSRCQHCAAQGKRQRKNGVFPLDHLQRQAKVVQGPHGLIVIQGLGSEVLEPQPSNLRPLTSDFGPQNPGCLHAFIFSRAKGRRVSWEASRQRSKVQGLRSVVRVSLTAFQPKT